MSEHQEQAALFEWAERVERRYPELQWLYAVPNGGHRHKLTAIKLKAEGVKPGVLDVHLDIPRHNYHGWRGELKVNNNKPTKSQKKWIEHHKQNGYFADWFKGWDAMRENLIWYLS